MKIKNLSLIFGFLLIILLVVPVSFAANETNENYGDNSGSDIQDEISLSSDISDSSNNILNFNSNSNYNSSYNSNSISDYYSNYNSSYNSNSISDYYSNSNFNSNSDLNSIDDFYLNNENIGDYNSNIGDIYKISNNNHDEFNSLDSVSHVMEDPGLDSVSQVIEDSVSQFTDDSSTIIDDVSSVNDSISTYIPNISFNMTFNGFNNIVLTNDNTVYVNASYTGSLKSGTKENPYISISSALANLGTKTNLFIANGTYIVNTIMEFTKSINIIGESTLNTVISGNDNSDLFSFEGSKTTVNMTNLTLANGYSNYGSAIYNNESTINLVNMIFKSNVADAWSYAAYGGAIYNDFGFVNIFNSLFVNNSASSYQDSCGGAIYNYIGSVNLVNSSFIGNKITGDYASGGAIYNFYGDFLAFNSSFINNSVVSDNSLGGAICNWGTHTSFILNSTLNNNLLSGKLTFGSAIASKAAILEIINSTISNNIANGTGVENETVYNMNGLYYFENSTMNNNTVRDTKNILMCLEDQLIVANKNDYVSSSVDLPDSFDLRNLSLVTSVKNQKSSGSCWAFATYAALESFLLKTENITYDFSENNMKNLMGYYGSNGTDWNTNTNGGNINMALAYLLRWSGTINETQDPYNPYSVSSKENLTVTKHVQDTLFIPISFSNFDEIKKALMDYGVLYTTIYCGDNFGMYGKYYSGSYGRTDHAVAIVGWDDNYSASNFDITPPGDGAFIIKNSWGTSYLDDGYIYVSYYDKTFPGLNCDFLSAMAFVNVENASNYKENYQYDPLGNTAQSLGYNCETAWFANQFTSNNNNPLAAFGLYTFAPSTYEAMVYVNNQLKYSQNGTIANAGYHTIKLEDYVELAKDDIFKIVIKLTSPGSLFPIAIESNIAGYSGNVVAGSDQSFISPDGVNWYDISKDTSTTYLNKFVYSSVISETNVCLKAYTAYASDLVLNATTNTSLYSNGDLVEITLNLTNFGDDATNINISSILDDGVVVKSYNSSIGSYDGLNNIWNIANLKSGEYGILKLVVLLNSNKEITNTFNISTNSYNVNNNSFITVKEYYSGFTALIGENMNTTLHSGDKINITLIDTLNKTIANKHVNLTLNGLSYDCITDANGVVSLAIDLGIGNYTLFAEFAGDEDYNKSSINLNINVYKIGLIMTADNYSGFYGVPGNFTAKLTDEFGNAIAGFECQLILRNSIGQSKIYYRATNTEGIVKLGINLIAANWTITACYTGNSNYSSVNSTGNVIISKNPSSNMLAYNYTGVYGVPGNFTAKLTDEFGDALIGYECQLTLMNSLGETKSYWRTTNYQGIMKLAINLIPGTWYITAYYPGNNGYYESNNSTGTLIISSL